MEKILINIHGGQMSGRKRRIYFFEPVEIDSQEVVTTFDKDFWPALHAHVVGLAKDESGVNGNRLRMEYLGNKYSGSARSEKSPAEDFFYIGKARPGSDWPDMEDAESQTSPLQLADPTANLVEPAYLLPVTGTQYVAALRTSSGPSWSAIENWIGAVSGRADQSNRFELRPYVRKDQLERLRDSLGISKLHLKVDADASADLQDVSGELATAIRKVQELGAGGVSVEVGLSFGRARPVDSAANKVARQVEKLITNVKFNSASATIMLPDGEGEKYVKRSIDFYKDRVTGSEYVGTNQEEAATPPVVLKAMAEAIRKFKTSLKTA